MMRFQFSALCFGQNPRTAFNGGKAFLPSGLAEAGEM